MANANVFDLPKDHPLSNFAAELPGILKSIGHSEMYGVELVAPSDDKPAPHTTLIILQKFLRANAGDLAGARTQLTNALKWRKEYNPRAALDEVYPTKKFGGLGYVTKIKGAEETKNDEDIATFNIYGAAANDPKNTFDKQIPDYGQGPDPYLAIQIHDYLSVSFFRQPAEIKASSSKIIDMFQKYYPETVSYKYFVNVPLVMQWMMGAMKMLMSKDSIQKMTWMTYGSNLKDYLGTDIPKEYGGSGPPLTESAQTVKYDDGKCGQTNNGETRTVRAEAIEP